MRTLLFLNGPEGCQKGIEDGFLNLRETNKIKEMKWFYHLDYLKTHSVEQTKNKMLEKAQDFQPELIVFFHIGDFPVSDNFFTSFRKIASAPKIVYDEGDMYGGWAKPINAQMKIAIRNADVVSIRGLGKWYKSVKKLHQNVIYTPHSNSLHRLSKNIILSEKRNREIIFIGNRVISKLGNIRRLPGASKREKTVLDLSRHFNSDLFLYGNGWNNLPGNKGPLEFDEQVKVCSNHWFHLSIEHYPSIPYYFSDRLPIALSSGQIYVCHYHKGYTEMFRNTDFIYFFKTETEAIDILNYLRSLSSRQLYSKSVNAKKWADNNLSPIVIWNNFYSNLEKFVS